MESFHDSAEVILKESSDIAPWATGEMASNTFITDAPTEGAVYFGYNGPYVVRQHQDPTLRHPDPTNPLSRSGRTDHFLQKAFDQGKAQAQEKMKQRVDAALK